MMDLLRCACRVWWPGLLLMLAACGPRANGPGSFIRLERAERPGYWRATYELERPTDFLLLQRPAAFYREGVWDVRTPGWSLVRRGDDQALEAAPGAASDRVVVEFPVYTDTILKEYELFESFTDGSVAIYTGHLYAAPDARDVPAEDAEQLRRLEIVPASDEHLIVKGEVLRGRTSWEDSQGDGTYVYFGRIPPLETDTMVAVIDPGAPDWLARRIDRMLPEMFALYTERFGEALPWKPVVLFNFEDVEMSGFSSGGGTLNGLVQLSAMGSAWHRATPETSEQLLHLLAHEAVHFWNGQLHSYEKMADSWMHEGSADAFADLVLLRLGAIDATRLAARRSEALNRCAAGLADGPLTSSLERGQFRNYYACGNLIALWSAKEIDGEGGDEERLFALWRELFRRADPDDGSYDRETYAGAMAALGATEQTIDALRAFVDEGHDDPSAALTAFMRRAGIELVTLDRPLPELRRTRVADALKHLMADACGRFSFYSEGRRLRTAVIEGCPPYDREMRIVSIEGHESGPAGDRAFEAARERCAHGEPVTLGLEDGTRVEVPCSSPLPPAPDPLGFPALPS